MNLQGITLKTPKVNIIKQDYNVLKIVNIEPENIDDKKELYDSFNKINPVLNIAVEKLGLTYNHSGEKTNTDFDKLDQKGKQVVYDLINEVFLPCFSHSKELIIQKIIQSKSVSETRAQNAFKLILQTNEIELTPLNEYYLKTSTPF